MHGLWDKFVFLFYAEIQDGRQKQRENNFWEKTENIRHKIHSKKSGIKNNACTQISVFVE